MDNRQISQIGARNKTGRNHYIQYIIRANIQASERTNGQPTPPTTVSSQGSRQPDLYQAWVVTATARTTNQCCSACVIENTTVTERQSKDGSGRAPINRVGEKQFFTLAYSCWKYIVKKVSPSPIEPPVVSHASCIERHLLDSPRSWCTGHEPSSLPPQNFQFINTTTILPPPALFLSIKQHMPRTLTRLSAVELRSASNFSTALYSPFHSFSAGRPAPVFYPPTTDAIQLREAPMTSAGHRFYP